MEEHQTRVPASILIIGNGVFGLSTAHALLTNPKYAQTAITLIDAYVPPAVEGSEGAECASGAEIEASTSALTASLDSSRIIRTDYAALAYAQLAAAAQERWRTDWQFATATTTTTKAAEENLSSKRGLQAPIYHEVGLICSGSEVCTNARGRAYVETSFANVQTLQGAAPPPVAAVATSPSVQCSGAQALENRDAIREAWCGSRDPPLPTEAEAKAGAGADDTAIGDFGYVNWRSGWADASGAMAAMRARVCQCAAERENAPTAPKLRWIHGRVERLLFEKAPDGGDGTHIVAGAQLADGTHVRATVTIVAAGAWSPQLLPRTLGGRVHAAGQPVSYIALNEAERRQLAGRPVLLNIGTALFVIPPPPLVEVNGNDSGSVSGNGAAVGSATHSVLKVAQHGWGYARTVSVPDTEPGAADGDAAGDGTVRVSIPPSTTQPIPPRSARELRAFLENILPEVARNKPFASTRLCWYADTPSGDFLIDYVPEYGRSCLVVTGGSGHGFKFLPVLGPYVVQRLEGRLGVDEDPGWEEENPREEIITPRNALSKTLAHRWRWRTEEELVEDRKMPGDGSRGGDQGLRWEDEMREVYGWEPPPS